MTMFMDIGHLRGFLFSVVKTSVLTAIAPSFGLLTIFVECVVPIQQTTKKANKKKKRTLKNLNLWIDEEYLQRKEERTVRDHKRDVIPNCIISYSYFFGLVYYISHAYHIYISRRKFLGVIRITKLSFAV